MKVSVSMASSKPAVRVSERLQRRRAHTRSRLIDGARALIANGGLERLTIADVTEEADVGFGTFYGYFDSKDDLTRAAVADTLERIGVENDALTGHLADPAEIMATAICHTLQLVEREPAWASFLVGVAFSPERSLWAGLRARVRRDVGAGVAGGRFSVPDVEVACALVCGAVLAGARARLDRDLAPEADPEIARGVLVMLGLSQRDAKAVVRRIGAPW